ncbi:ribonuclease H-like domain-containing protein [Tanacetum coccineum]
MVTHFRVGSNRPMERFTLNVFTVSPFPKSYSAAFNDHNWQKDILAVSRHSHFHQLDIKNELLNGSLLETVYMHQPPGFRDPQHAEHIGLL